MDVCGYCHTSDYRVETRGKCAWLGKAGIVNSNMGFSITSPGVVTVDTVLSAAVVAGEGGIVVERSKSFERSLVGSGCDS